MTQEVLKTFLSYKVFIFPEKNSQFIPSLVTLITSPDDTLMKRNKNPLFIDRQLIQYRRYIFFVELPFIALEALSFQLYVLTTLIALEKQKKICK